MNGLGTIYLALVVSALVIGCSAAIIAALELPQARRRLRQNRSALALLSPTSADADILRVAMRRDAFAIASFSLLPMSSRRRIVAIAVISVAAAMLAGILSGVEAIYPLSSQGSAGATLAGLESALLGAGVIAGCYGYWLRRDCTRTVNFLMNRAAVEPGGDAMHRWGADHRPMPSWQEIRDAPGRKRSEDGPGSSAPSPTNEQPAGPPKALGAPSRSWVKTVLSRFSARTDPSAHSEEAGSAGVDEPKN